jgi:hypothetical protein
VLAILNLFSELFIIIEAIKMKFFLLILSGIFISLIALSQDPLYPFSRITPFTPVQFPSDTLRLEPSDTLRLEPSDTLRLVSLDTLNLEPSDSLILVSLDTLNLEPSDTLSLEPSDTLILEPSDTLILAPSDSLRKDALRVYMFASDYVKQEISFINYVRDLKDAQVYIISTTQETGSGGKEYSYLLIGQHEFDGMRDTIIFNTSPDDTPEQTRQKEVSMLKMALMRYVVKTPLGKYIDIDFNAPIKEEVTTDKWKNWVFKLSAFGYINGEKSYNSNTYFGSISMKKITEKWKINFSFDFSNTSDKYEYDYETYKYNYLEKTLTALMVKSLGDHWGIGLSASGNQSTYSKYDLRILLMPGIEFNAFPYSESTRKLLTFNYSAGYFHHDYTDTTIYNQSYEILWGHVFEVIYSIIQKWGYGDIGLEWMNYFHDWDLNRLSFYTSFNFRIAKGLTVDIGAGASMIHNQINLPKGGASKEEVLLRRKELETQFSFYSQVGFTYTFGSIYSNVVNPRFKNGGAAKRIID